jgi:hypothetical protein
MAKHFFEGKFRKKAEGKNLSKIPFWCSVTLEFLLFKAVLHI